MSNRLDQELVRRGLAESRSRAQAMIIEGLVAVGGIAATKASRSIGAEDVITLLGEPMPWVSRGALKLVHALDHFVIDPKGLVALDLGASTGGFAEVLVSRGAQSVHAVDVGHGQLHARLQAEPRIQSLEGTDVRDLVAGMVPAPQLITADLAFISLRKALGPALDLALPHAVLVALVKPQFEVGRENVGKGGIVRDPAARAGACDAVAAFLEAEGWAAAPPIESPIAGGDGNVEFLLMARKR